MNTLLLYVLFYFYLLILENEYATGSVYNIKETPFDYRIKHLNLKETIKWNRIREHLLQVQDSVPDTVPDNIKCNKIKYCDSHGVCALVCEQGTVEIDPWITNTLAFQRKLMRNMSLCDIQIPGTHNSAIALANGYGVEDRIFDAVLRYVPFVGHYYGVHTNDQIFSLTDQLQMGIRFLELDIHWFDNDLRIAHCGGFHSHLLNSLISSINKIVKLLHLKIQWDSETIGCKPSLSSIPAEDQRRLYKALEEIAQWLHSPENKDEFLIIFFDDESDLFRWNKVEFVVKYINQYFNRSEIFLPSNITSKDQRWPSMSELISQGRHIMFLSGVDLGAVAEGLLFVKDKICHWTEPSTLSFTAFPTCQFRDTVTKYIPHRIWRPQTTEIQYGYLNGDGHLGPNLWPLNNETLPPLVQCGINIPSPDNMTPERIKSWIWTWADGHPIANYSCTGIPKADLRWHSLPCNKEYLFACRDLSRGKWYLQKSGKCPGRLIFTYPKTPLQQQHLIYELERSAAKGVYINFSMS